MTLDSVRLTPYVYRVYSEAIALSILHQTGSSVRVFSNNLPRKSGMSWGGLISYCGTHASIFTSPMNEILQSLDVGHPRLKLIH